MASVANKPFRFIYTSGVTIERDQGKSLPFLSDSILCVYVNSFVLISLQTPRELSNAGRAETAILEFAKQHRPGVEVTVTKPGGIEAPGYKASTSAAMKKMLETFGYTPTRILRKEDYLY
ncbi:hypothetical protein JMJ35_006941 [Cladonia borealis]|uniref:Uncharacterized protein n=1 Tax=Cladonia borealis TaxID=184061 RepID=A0AA39V3Y0_9LECA|nr:hypothetical protein JMJ35_006941 [Cladonia borealis]